ncbi:3'-5' exonuclease [Teichococcus cervicalis]|uniref:Putative DNA polymerase III, epsilon subunit n=1 Tax=Pseudoroseomonas cervicalis ATCC 49957 TaxID=525371 RepID=D5RJN7_9PROT|nr:3'-5' exonuclease [Pseudoroseomonas cervicalis]EFH12483.1 putative DNA polymerase III, epsilon subunit [Pseudoroseomonas cervicalis ATCC 49957]
MPLDAPPPPDPAALEAMAAALEASGEYRVLRRIAPRPSLPVPQGAATRLGLVLDVETTGLDHGQDEIIELAMLPFTYGLDGTLYSVGEAFSRLRQPARPIPPEVTALTGLTDAMVAGQSFTPEEVAAFIGPAALVIAHNAGFDRRFAEAFCPDFAAKPWACSLHGVDWAAEGFEGRRLGDLAARHGLFFDGHRAVHDCQATLEILARPLPRSGVPALVRLLEAARRPSWRIWAEGAPFAAKDRLKARGYRWNGEANGRPRAWYIEVAEEQLEAETAFLRSEIYAGEVDVPMRRLTALERFSERG